MAEKIMDSASSSDCTTIEKYDDNLTLRAPLQTGWAVATHTTRLQMKIEALEEELGAAKKSIAALYISIDAIESNPDGLRLYFDENKLSCLADSIRAHGMISPLTLRRHSSHPDKYVLIKGERRLLAARMVGLTQVPARVLEVDERDAILTSISLNIDREPLAEVEYARAADSIKSKCQGDIQGRWSSGTLLQRVEVFSAKASSKTFFPHFEFGSDFAERKENQ